MSWDVAREAAGAHSSALVEAMLFEDGLAATVEAVESGVAGFDVVTLQLGLMRLLAADLAQRLTSTDPFTIDERDEYFVDASPATPPSAGGGDATRWEQVAVETHVLMNQVGAARARSVAEFARWGRGVDPWSFVQHPAGHRDEDAGDQIGPVLRLGTHEADRLVDESVWIATRTPGLLEDVATGRANLATVAAIATEVQDARPQTCERVEAAVRRRGVHRSATRVRARRSARTLVEGFEASAARVTRRRTVAQQTGVWLDPHPTPGLASLSAAMPAADAEALMSAIDDRATRLHRERRDGRLLGQHRADALVELALKNVTFTAHLEVIGADPASGGLGESTPARGQVLATLRSAPLVLVPKVGAVSGSEMAAVLSARVSGKRQALTMTIRSGHEAGIDGSPAYRPPKPLRESVIRRDQHCRFPGCTRPARFADLDHVVPWPNGATTTMNLQCLCRRHHRVKQRHWQVSMVPTGVCIWTSPLGRRHLTVPGRTSDLADLDDVGRGSG